MMKHHQFPAPLQPIETALAQLPPRAEAKAADVNDLILKQKLDCVLQLAQTVSLDFNNALTSVLAILRCCWARRNRGIRGGIR